MVVAVIVGCGAALLLFRAAALFLTVVLVALVTVFGRLVPCRPFTLVHVHIVPHCAPFAKVYVNGVACGNDRIHLEISGGVLNSTSIVRDRNLNVASAPPLRGLDLAAAAVLVHLALRMLQNRGEQHSGDSPVPQPGTLTTFVVAHVLRRTGKQRSQDHGKEESSQDGCPESPRHSHLVPVIVMSILEETEVIVPFVTVAAIFIVVAVNVSLGGNLAAPPYPRDGFGQDEEDGSGEERSCRERRYGDVHCLAVALAGLMPLLLRILAEQTEAEVTGASDARGEDDDAHEGGDVDD
mmetsp:Transcript_12970/g.38102  ORF Transcript_12970/g.38102 Transcript_12970/m.38102 type:complete len:295 (-) Transcript_12970:833-1717(-)